MKQWQYGIIVTFLVAIIGGVGIFAFNSLQHSSEISANESMQKVDSQGTEAKHESEKLSIQEDTQKDLKDSDEKIVAHTNPRTDSFNYAEALQKSIMFYEFQRSGKLDGSQRNNWRGDSALNDGKDVGLDLTGGWFDAGDHVKFNLPMAYTATMLAWSVTEDADTYIQSGQYDAIMKEIKWANDYFIKCHPEPNVYYFQVGDGNIDHNYWVPAEVMQMNRPSYKLDANNHGSAVSAQTAAALASAAVVFKDKDPAYAKLCLKHAKELYSFAEAAKSNAYYDQVAGAFYKSWSGYDDELAWAGVWLNLATEDKIYLDKAEKYFKLLAKEGQLSNIDYKWAHSWDDARYGTALMLTRITENVLYKEFIEKHLDYWTTGVNGEKIHYTPKGLAWLDQWGALRYATTTAYLASVYAEWEKCPQDKKEVYIHFAKSQADYALGSTGRSFMIGYGENYPQRPHHRTAHGGWANNISGAPQNHRHILVGALVGGPGREDQYVDKIEDYVSNEVACDYNAGFTGLLAKLYKQYGGELIPNLTAIEEVGEELFIEAGINAQDNISKAHYIEIRAMIYNHTAWPAKVTDQLSFRYFMDLTDVIGAGYKPSDMKVTSNYNQGVTSISQVTAWDAAKNIYYVTIDFKGTQIYPGGESERKKEIQFRITAPGKWDYTKSFSFQGLENTGNVNLIKAEKFALYSNNELVYGSQP